MYMYLLKTANFSELPCQTAVCQLPINFTTNKAITFKNVIGLQEFIQ